MVWNLLFTSARYKPPEIRIAISAALFDIIFGLVFKRKSARRARNPKEQIRAKEELKENNEHLTEKRERKTSF